MPYKEAAPLTAPEAGRQELPQNAPSWAQDILFPNRNKGANPHCSHKSPTWSRGFRTLSMPQQRAAP